MRVLICGGRSFDKRTLLRTTLNRLHKERGPFKVIIHGGAQGADSEASMWAKYFARPRIEMLERYRPDWRRYKKAAGPIRNERMLDEGQPDLVIAFPGGKGTAGMVKLAKARGLEVIEVKE